MDINAEDFTTEFDVDSGVIGVIGNGFVGHAVAEFFKGTFETIVYDKAQEDLSEDYGGVVNDSEAKLLWFGSLNDVVAQAHVIFVAVPTPMKNDGHCYTGFVEEVISRIKEAAKEIKRDKKEFVIVLKSTVPPGFTEKLSYKNLDLRIVFSPEFLREASSVEDFKKDHRVILGGDQDDAVVVFKFFEAVRRDDVNSGALALFQCNPTVAELVKLYTNGMLATKVMFSNEIYLICQELGVEYNDVRQLSVFDKRISWGHTFVPGPDGNLGFGGHCFPKDLKNLIATARDLGTNEKIFSAVDERNREIREDRDWEKMKNRAVIDE